MRKVVLIGYMGSGKSVIAKKLSDITGIPAVELDECIAQKCQMSVKEIFKNKGEVFFRKTEHELFSELIHNDKPLIISTGGGTPCYFNNHTLLNAENVISIYLKASIATLYDRLVQEKNNRPLLAPLADDELNEYIAKHLFDRSFYYNQATHTLDVNHKTPEEIVEVLKNILT